MFSFIKRVFQPSATNSIDPPLRPVEEDSAFAEFAAMTKKCEELGISAQLDDLHDAYQNYRIVRALLDRTEAEKPLADDYAHCAHEMLLKTSAFVKVAAEKGIEAKPAARKVIALVYDDLKARKIA